MSEYEPFGDEWKAEVMRLKKSEIVDMLAKALRGKEEAQPCVQRTAFAAGVVAGFVGFIVGLLLGAC